MSQLVAGSARNYSCRDDARVFASSRLKISSRSLPVVGYQDTVREGTAGTRTDRVKNMLKLLKN